MAVQSAGDSDTSQCSRESRVLLAFESASYRGVRCLICMTMQSQFTQDSRADVRVITPAIISDCRYLSTAFRPRPGDRGQQDTQRGDLSHLGTALPRHHDPDTSCSIDRGEQRDGAATARLPADSALLVLRGGDYCRNRNSPYRRFTDSDLQRRKNPGGLLQVS